MSQEKKLQNRQLRKDRIRSRIRGTADRPRLSVYVSNKHVSAQLVDDVTGNTIASASTIGSDKKSAMSELATGVGTDIAKKAKKAKITSVVFDRNGRLYAKRLRALADAARKEGLEF